MPPGKLLGVTLVIVGIRVGVVMFTGIAAEGPPPGPGFTTVTSAEPGVATNDACPVPLRAPGFDTVVLRGTPLKFIVALEAKSDPVAYKVNCTVPTAMFVGDTLVRTGTGYVPTLIVKLSGFELPRLGDGLVTVTTAIPGSTMSDSWIVAVTCAVLTKVVFSGTPLKDRTVPTAKPKPFTVRVKAGPPESALVGDSVPKMGAG